MIYSRDGPCYSKKIIKKVKKANSKLKGDQMGKLSPLKTILDREGNNLTFDDIRLAKLSI